MISGSVEKAVGGLNVMEININPSSYWFIDVYPNSNMDNKLKRERNIYIYGK